LTNAKDITTFETFLNESEVDPSAMVIKQQYPLAVRCEWIVGQS